MFPRGSGEPSRSRISGMGMGLTVDDKKIWSGSLQVKAERPREGVELQVSLGLRALVCADGSGDSGAPASTSSRDPGPGYRYSPVAARSEPYPDRWPIQAGFKVMVA